MSPVLGTKLISSVLMYPEPEDKKDKNQVKVLKGCETKFFN